MIPPYIHKEKYRPKVITKMQQALYKLMQVNQQLGPFFKYFIVGGLIGGGLLVNNYELIFKFLNLPDARLRRRLDRWFGKSYLDQNVKVELPDDNILDNEDLTVRSDEEILQIKRSFSTDSSSKTKKKQSVMDIHKMIDSESNILKDLQLNKKLLHLLMLELDSNIIAKETDRDLVVKGIKKEYENQNRILEDIYKKLNKSNQNEMDQWKELKLENNNIIKAIYLDINNFDVFSEFSNIKNMNHETKNKELEIMRNYLANYNTELTISYQVIQQLNEKFSYVSNQIKSISDEVSSKRNSIEKLRKLEEDYLTKKQSLTENLLNAHFEKVATVSAFEEREQPDKETKSLGNPEVLLKNDQRILNLIDYLFNQISTTNNINNLSVYNRSLQYFNRKLSNISSLFQDDMAIDLIKISNPKSQKRFYTNTEIFNEFQSIKRDLFFNIFQNEVGVKYLSNDPVFTLLIGSLLSKATEFFLRMMNTEKMEIKESDHPLVKKLKAFNLVSYNIKASNYPKAYTNLKYLKEEDYGYLHRLQYKLEAMTRERLSIELLKNKFI